MAFVAAVTGELSSIHIWNRCLDDIITLVWCAELYLIFYVNKFEFRLFDKMSSFDGFKEEDDVKTSGFHLIILIK